MANGNVIEEIFKLNVDTVEAIKNMQNLAGTYEKITAEQRAQIVELKILEEKERQLQAQRLKTLNPTSQVLLTNKIRENKKEIDNLTKSVSLFAAETEQATDETNALAQSVSNAFKTTAVTGATNEIKKLNSVYDTTRLKYNELAKAQAELSIRGRENGVVFRGIKQEAESLRSQLDKAGGSASGFANEFRQPFNSLQNSINQVSRELPAFAVNANTGFLAISNNLPILFDALSRTSAETKAMTEAGKAVPSVLSQVGKAVFSVGSLLSVGVTLLTLYGGSLVKVISSAFDASEAFELETQSLEILNDEYDRQIKLQESLLKARNNTNKEIAKLGLADPQQQLLESTDKALDSFNEIEKGYTKAVGKAILTQLQLTEKEFDFATKRTNNAIEIENKKTGTIIRLNLEMNKVLGQYSAFYNKNLLTNQDVAIQAQLDKLNKARQGSLKELNFAFNAEVDLIEGHEAEKQSIRERFVDRDLIRQRSALDEIRQLQIDNGKDEQQREIENEIFSTEKAIREIDLANETEKKKLAIARQNFDEKVRIEKANEKDQQQLNFNLIKINQEFSKEVQRIRAENIPKEQQIELRLRLEEELFIKLQGIQDKFNKELTEKIKDDVRKTFEARIGIINENNAFELFLLEDKYKVEREKGTKANKDELADLKTKIKAKKILILEEKAAQDIANLSLNENKEKNAAEVLEIENKLRNDIERLNHESNAKMDKEDDERRKKLIQRYIGYLADLIHATIDATNKIISIKIRETDALIQAQTKRVEESKNIAERGNAEVLEMEQKRLDDLTKKKEKFVRDQQALAAVELVANTAIAVSKAAAEGGAGAAVTIAAALIALVAGLASARSIASQAAFYEGGYTGDGNPTQESQAVGKRSYIYHKEEFVMNHKKTRQFRDIFEDVHRGRVDLNDWKEKANAYDQMVSYKGFTTSAPTQTPQQNVNIIQFKGLESKMGEVVKSIDALHFGLNVDEDGFTKFMKKRNARTEQIKRFAKL